MHLYAPITRLSSESHGLVVTAENGPTKLEFVCSDPVVKRELKIGMGVRAIVEIKEQ